MSYFTEIVNRIKNAKGIVDKKVVNTLEMLLVLFENPNTKDSDTVTEAQEKHNNQINIQTMEVYSTDRDNFASGLMEHVVEN